MQHGDPFGGSSTKCLYDASNYANAADHPPLIGYSMDGFPIFGRYLDTLNLGQGTNLDDCGGHQHSGVDGYHYHSQVVQIPASDRTPSYTAYIAGPYKCWKGDISKNKNFWLKDSGPTASASYGVGGPVTNRADYEQLRPCCS